MNNREFASEFRAAPTDASHDRQKAKKREELSSIEGVSLHKKRDWLQKVRDHFLTFKESRSNRVRDKAQNALRDDLMDNPFHPNKIDENGETYYSRTVVADLMHFGSFVKSEEGMVGWGGQRLNESVGDFVATQQEKIREIAKEKGIREDEVELPEDEELPSRDEFFGDLSGDTPSSVSTYKKGEKSPIIASQELVSENIAQGIDRTPDLKMEEAVKEPRSKKINSNETSTETKPLPHKGEEEAKLKRIRENIFAAKNAGGESAKELFKKIDLEKGDLPLNRERLIEVYSGTNQKKGLFKKLVNRFQGGETRDSVAKTKAVMGYDRALEKEVREAHAWLKSKELPESEIRISLENAFTQELRAFGSMAKERLSSSARAEVMTKARESYQIVKKKIFPQENAIDTT